MHFRRLKSRIGFVGGVRERSLVFIANEIAAIEPIIDLIESLSTRDTRLHVVLASANPKVLAWLGQIFPSLSVLPLPYSNRLSSAIFLRQLKARVVAFVEAQAGIPKPLLSAIKALAIGTVTISGRTINELLVSGDLAAASEARVLVSDKAFSQGLPAGITFKTKDDLMEIFGIMMARDLKALRGAGLLSRIATNAPMSLAASQHWRWLITWRVLCLQNVEELKERLGSTKTIMCLGNGPSSEDPILETLDFDVLFRVNHSWLKRRIFVAADVIFTGGKPTMRAVKNTIFGVPTPEAERFLLAVRSYNPAYRRTEFFNVNDMTTQIREFDWGHVRPTNGACMLAVAVALQPAKLIVAGVDLFQHPQGSYPGDRTTANAYSPGHSRDTELEFILHLFSIFLGELTIVGDVLGNAWEHYKKNNPKQPAR
jgi:hypothetical protein